MAQQSVRPAAVAGSWYPARPDSLAREVDGYLAQASAALEAPPVALVAPHAGLVYSGPVAACAYRTVRGGPFDVVVLVGPSHYVGFDGVAICARGAFETPLGPAVIDEPLAEAIAAASPAVHEDAGPHAREHSLEMQLPFLRRVLPEAAIVPLVMGYQERETILELGRALGEALRGRRALLVASTDLSHFFDARRAAALDGRVVDCVRRFDPEALLDEFERYPEAERGRYVACGGGPAISVMRAARALGATTAAILKYGDSGDVSGDKSRVVGYLAAAMGRFSEEGGARHSG